MRESKNYSNPSTEEKNAPLYEYEFQHESGFLFTVSAHNRVEASKIARERIYGK